MGSQGMMLTLIRELSDQGVVLSEAANFDMGICRRMVRLNNLDVGISRHSELKLLCERSLCGDDTILLQFCDCCQDERRSLWEHIGHSYDFTQRGAAAFVF